MIIKIYNGAGVSEESLKHSYNTLKLYTSSKYSISYISPEEIIRGTWIQETHLLVLPGGADIHYARALNGPGNNLIKKFIIQGGNFLGICAGSYYGGNYVEFAKSSNIEVTGKRELGLYNGTVRGPILCDYYYDSDRGARAAEIIINPNFNQHLKDCYVFYNGGGYFVNAENISNTKILAKYNIANSYAAIIECKYGKGTAILSGVHFEYDPNIMNSTSLYHIINILKESNQKRIMLLHYLFKILSIDH